MATLTITPTTETIIEGGTFIDPKIKAFADDGTTDVSDKVTGPVPSPDVNQVGTQTLVYTLPAIKDEVVQEITETFTLIVEAAPVVSDIEKFIDGSKDRYGNDITNKAFKDAVQNPPAGEDLSSLFDEEALDPYELAHAKANK